MALTHTVTLVLHDPLERGLDEIDQAIKDCEALLEDRDLFVHEVEVES